MKKIRIVSFLLTLVMILSLFSGLTASAKTGTVTRNTGKRHEVCTSLSSQAKAYYTGEYTFDKLASLEGGNESCLSTATTGSALYKKLNKLMTDTQVFLPEYYDGLKAYFPYTDCNNGGSSMQLFYSDTGSNSFNREHVWPKSRASFLRHDGGCDIHHLRPANSDVNTARSNYTMGNVRGKISTYETYKYNGKSVLYYNGAYTGNGCDGLVEINDNIKGDVARIYLYIYVRWQEPNLFENTPNPVVGPNDDKNNGKKVIESLETLLQWCEMDPVDTWEMGRNDQGENLQGNRNVFIDYPEFAWLIFGQDVPEDMTTPSGEAQNFGYTITAESNNEEYGTVSLKGKTITASPKEGYAISQAEPFTISPKGAATVKQEGNKFTLSNVTADCTVTVNFEKLIPATLSYSVPEGISCTASASGYVGYSVKLPTVSNVLEGFTFWCWSESFADRTIVESYSGYKAGEDYTLTKESATLYAVFRYNEKQDGGWLFTSVPTLCDHENTKLVNVTEPTCTKNGNTGDTYCTDCESIIRRGEAIPALGHDHQNGICTRCGDCQHLNKEYRDVKEVTCTENGYTGDTYCTDCGAKVYRGSTIRATGHDYEGGICQNCGEKDPNASDEPKPPVDDPKPPVDDPKPPVEDPEDNPFKDVKESDYYYAPVLWAVEKGITNGTSPNTFSPDASCTRGQIVTFLWRACGSPEPSKTDNPFTDVKSGEYYYKAVLWAVEEGITTGLSDTSFGPDAGCTRGQVATFLWRAQGKPAPVSSENPFSDVSSSDYYYEAVLWAVENNVTQGTGAGKFSPNASCTRGQIVTFLYRAIAE